MRRWQRHGRKMVSRLNDRAVLLFTLPSLPAAPVKRCVHNRRDAKSTRDSMRVRQELARRTRIRGEGNRLHFSGSGASTNFRAAKMFSKPHPCCPLPHTGRTWRWWSRRGLSLPPTAMSGAETLTPERVDQRSFTRCMVLDALVERGVASASLAKPRRSVLQLKTMLKDLLAGGGD
ncbi:MAG: hypothetical protein ACPIOQ_26925, partial [Promethearchaeia archaeon]